LNQKIILNNTGLTLRWNKMNTYKNNDIFLYNTAVNGGTEQMVKTFLSDVLPKNNIFNKYICVVLPGNYNIEYNLEYILKNKKQMIIWLHNTIDQYDDLVKNLFVNKKFQNKIKFIIVVSEWHKQDIINSINIEENKVLVVNNYVDYAECNNDKFNNVEKIKIINTSAPARYLQILLNSLKYIKNDFEFNIFGNFSPDLIPEEMLHYYPNLDDKRIFFYGKSPKKTINKTLNESHIYAYPSVFEETFCLSIVEAASYGCIPLYNSIGSMPEVLDNEGVVYFADCEKLNNLYDFKTANKEVIDTHAKMFAKELDTLIEKIKNKDISNLRLNNNVSKKYSKENFIYSWLKVADML
jgi:glycosyltransferase involved in cell wall biosynthesis